VLTYGGGTFAGYVNGNLMAARFNDINGITVDKHGTFYIADTANHVIRRISKGIVSKYAGVRSKPGFDDGNGNNNLQKL
jgi:hypothetical protein